MQMMGRFSLRQGLGGVFRRCVRTLQACVARSISRVHAKPALRSVVQSIVSVMVVCARWLVHDAMG